MKKLKNFHENLLVSVATSLLFLLIFSLLLQISKPVSALLSAVVFGLYWQYEVYSNDRKKSLSLAIGNLRVAAILFIIAILGTINQVFNFYFTDWLIITSYPLLIVAAIFIVCSQVGIDEMKVYFEKFSIALLVILATRLFMSIYFSYLVGAVVMYLLIIYHLYRGYKGTNDVLKNKLINFNSNLAFSIIIIGIIGGIFHLISGEPKFPWQVIFSWPLVIVGIIIIIPSFVPNAPVVDG